MTKELRGVKPRTFKQKYFSDPVSAFVVFFFLLIFKILPLDAASFCGEKLGSLMGLLFKAKNKTAIHNLTKVFPGKTEEEKKRIIREMWKNLGRLCGEIPHLNKIVRTRMQVEGKERLKLAATQAHTASMVSSACPSDAGRSISQCSSGIKPSACSSRSIPRARHL